MLVTVFFPLMGGWAVVDDSDATVGETFTLNGITYKITTEEFNNIVSVIAKDGGKYSGDILVPSIVVYNEKSYNVQIGDGAFSNCPSLTKVTIEGSMYLSINTTAFDNSPNLTDINITGHYPYYGSDDGVLYSKNSGKIVKCPEGKTGSYVMGDTMSQLCQIPADAFKNCTKLTSITISDDVTKIEEHAFDGCPSLEAINVSENNMNFKSEDDVLFDYSMTSLIKYLAKKDITEYTIPESVKTIYGGAFLDCHSLEKITIPASVTDIGADVFKNCVSLKSVTVGACNIAKSLSTFDKGLEYIIIAKGATGFSNELFKNYLFFDKNGEITSEAAIAGHEYAADSEGKMIQLVEYTVTYDVDGGSEPAPTQESLADGETFNIASYDGTKDGCTFKGWSDGTKTYQPGDAYTVSGSSVTLKAVWEKTSGSDGGMPVWAIVLIVIAAIVIIAMISYYFLAYRKGKSLSDLFGRKTKI